MLLGKNKFALCNNQHDKYVGKLETFFNLLAPEFEI
jgi:hypothetical protein